jgi:hypothetical protein
LTPLLETLFCQTALRYVAAPIRSDSVELWRTVRPSNFSTQVPPGGLTTTTGESLMRTLTALVCAFMLVPASQAAAATLRVAPSGSDSAACSTTAPCASFNRAYQASRPGDTIEVAGGNYGGQTVNAKHAVGTAKVTFRPVAGAAVTIGSLSNYAQ